MAIEESMIVVFTVGRVCGDVDVGEARRSAKRLEEPAIQPRERYQHGPGCIRRAGASMIDLVPASEPRVESGINVDHFCLGIDTGDLAAAINYLRANSVEVLGEPASRYGARGLGNSIYLRDPEGNVVELKQMPSAQSEVREQK